MVASPRCEHTAQRAPQLGQPGAIHREAEDVGAIGTHRSEAGIDTPENELELAGHIGGWELATVLGALLETLRLIAIWTWPVMPAKCEAMWAVLGLPGSPGDPSEEAAQ